MKKTALLIFTLLCAAIMLTGCAQNKPIELTLENYDNFLDSIRIEYDLNSPKEDAPKHHLYDIKGLDEYEYNDVTIIFEIKETGKYTTSGYEKMTGKYPSTFNETNEVSITLDNSGNYQEESYSWGQIITEKRSDGFSTELAYWGDYSATYKVIGVSGTVTKK